MRQSGEAEIGIILPQEYPVFCPGGKHTVGFIYALIDKIINENSYISLVTRENKRILFLEVQMGINTCHKALTGGLLITGSTIDLPSKE